MHKDDQRVPAQQHDSLDHRGCGGSRKKHLLPAHLRKHMGYSYSGKDVTNQFNIDMDAQNDFRAKI